MSLSLNVGGWDRKGRVILGVALIALAYFGVVSGTMAIVAYVVAAIALITAMVKFCPANAIIGINTCEAKSSKSDD